MSDMELIERMEYEILGVDVDPETAKLGARAGSEIITSLIDAQTRKKAEKAGAEANKEKDAAVKAAADAQKVAMFAAADASAELYPQGPLHQKAQALAGVAMAAAQKAAYYGAPLPAGMQPLPPSGPSFLDKMKRNPLPYVAGGLGIAAALSILIALLRRRK
jgi:hypothetical protein